MRQLILKLAGLIAACILFVLPGEASASPLVLMKGRTALRGGFDGLIQLPTGKTLDVANVARAIWRFGHAQNDILYCDLGTGEMLNLSTVTRLSLSNLLTDPSRYNVLIYSPAIRRLMPYKDYIALSGLASPTLGSVLEGIGTLAVILDDTFLLPKQGNCRLYGDSNLDGQFNLADLTTLVDFLLGRSPLVPGSQAFANSDVNADGRVDMFDLNLIVDCILGRKVDQPSGFCSWSHNPPQKPVPPCAADVTTQVTITRSGFTFNFTTGRFSQTVRLTNKSTSSISGPISLVLDNLSSNATLYNTSSNTNCAAPAGSPYTTVLAVSLSSGASASVVLQFTNPSKAAITYNARVLDGSGTR